MEKVVILNNIRSNENVGSIFRTSDAAGVSKIILTGYTPAPLDRFGRKNKALSKSALGAEEFVGWESVASLQEAVEKLKIEGFKIIGVEQSEGAIDYKNYKPDSVNEKIAFVFGNEVTGLSEEDLALCDEVVEIKMKGKKESLNVAVCAGIILFN